MSELCNTEKYIKNSKSRENEATIHTRKQDEKSLKATQKRRYNHGSICAFRGMLVGCRGDKDVEPRLVCTQVRKAKFPFRNMKRILTFHTKENFSKANFQPHVYSKPWRGNIPLKRLSKEGS
mmetsp:Transcript_13060/g.24763  ORF Transcript_13060/g.24763 Transcript_13060/m.24763 type:complete len:122 (-) Transcript_13060:38-403(-)